MQADYHDVTWLAHWQRLSIGELAIFSGLDTHAMALAIMLLDRIEEVEGRLAACQSLVPRQS